MLAALLLNSFARVGGHYVVGRKRKDPVAPARGNLFVGEDRPSTESLTELEAASVLRAWDYRRKRRREETEIIAVLAALEDI